MFQRLQVQLTVLFTAFVLLVIVSVAVTYLGLQTQQQDALIVNLAGRQRMLTQQMARLAIQWGGGNRSALAALQESEQIFSQTLSALRNGGTAPYLADSYVNLPPTRDSQVLAALADEQSAWDVFHATLEMITADPPSSSILTESIEQQSDELVKKADAVVNLYETTATAKVNRLRAIQVTFLACALALLATGAWVTRRSLLKPLQDLSLIAKRLGENDLDSPVQVEGPAEMRALSQVFDEMRIRLHTAREELKQWNATLEQRIAQRTLELETLNEVSREISSRLDIQQVLDSVTEKARALLGGEIASLCLVDENQHWLRLQAVSGPKEAVTGQVAAVNEGLAADVLTSQEALLCGTGACQGGCRMLTEKYRASHVAAPLRVGERVIGALCVGSPSQNQFAVEAGGMMTKLANVAAVALENARLYAQAERVATLEERRRVATEMHDGLGQTLSYLGLMTDQVVGFLSDGKDEAALERLKKTRETIQAATAEVRRAIDNLMSESPSVLDLRTRLQNAVRELVPGDTPKIDWEMDEGFAPDCSRQAMEQVLNIIREAIKNAVRHADAAQVIVQAGETEGHYFVSVMDDGHGFDTTQAGPKGHFGLQIMKARAAVIGGQVEIESQANRGSRVTLIWPARAKE